jgi:hypothetical protein
MVQAGLFAMCLAGIGLGGAPAIAGPGEPGLPRGAISVQTSRWVEEWNPALQRWERVADDHGLTRHAAAPLVAAASHPAAGGKAADAAIARFGPFAVLDDSRAAIVGSTDASSPRQFDAMLAAYPGLRVIEFHDAGGTTHDLANLAVGRRIRAAGLATHVPSGGSARSGAVELFLAGVRRTMAPDALFAVHSWRDSAGREPRDFASDAPANRLYLDYYTEMGMTLDEARSFYAMTNSVPHARALWLNGAQMDRWIPRSYARIAAARSGIAWQDGDGIRPSLP